MTRSLRNAEPLLLRSVMIQYSVSGVPVLVTDVPVMRPRDKLQMRTRPTPFAVAPDRSGTISACK